MSLANRGWMSVCLSLILCLGLSVSAAQAQSGSLEPPSTAVNGSGDPVATTQTQPSWDQNLPASERFTMVIGGGAVLDKHTGLVWEQSPGETDGVPGITLADRSLWRAARLTCADRTVGGLKGWRLPAFHELASLVDSTQQNPALSIGHPFSRIQIPGLYWSATTDSNLPVQAWVVGFSNGLVGQFAKSNVSFVWCVRGGGPLSEY